MSRIRSGEFSAKTKLTLEKRAGGMCSLCYQITSIPHSLDEKYVQLGEAAHIHGISKSSNNRFISTLSKSELAHISNGIWLCSTCHSKIDRDQTKYSAEFLKKEKKNHEKSIENGILSYSKFKEYQNLEYKLFYLETSLKDKSESYEEAKQEIKTLSDERATLLDNLKNYSANKQELNDLRKNLKALIEDPKTAKSYDDHLVLGLKYKTVENEKSVFHFKKALEIYDGFRARFELGLILQHNQQTFEALEQFRYIINFDFEKDSSEPLTPDLVDAYFGSIFYFVAHYCDKDDYESALKLLNKVRKTEMILNQNNIHLTNHQKLSLQKYHGYVYWRSGKLLEARIVYQDAFDRAFFNIDTNGHLFLEIATSYLKMLLFDIKDLQAVRDISTKLFKSDLNKLNAIDKLLLYHHIAIIAGECAIRNNYYQAFYISNKAIKLLYDLTDTLPHNILLEELLPTLSINLEAIMALPDSNGRKYVFKNHWFHIGSVYQDLEDKSKIDLKFKSFLDRINHWMLVFRDKYPEEVANFKYDNK